MSENSVSFCFLDLRPPFPVEEVFEDKDFDDVLVRLSLLLIVALLECSGARGCSVE